LAKPTPEPSPRQVFLLQRSKDKPGYRLGKTTGWIHRTSLKMKRVQMFSEVQYHKIDDEGFHVTIKGEPQILKVDNVIVCAGQEPLRELYEPLQQLNIPVHLIGGAFEAVELDAKRAIRQATEIAISI